MYIILYFIFYTLLSWWRLDWALMFLIFALPSYLIRFHVFNIPSTLLEGMIFIAFAVYFVKNYQQIWERIKYRLKYRLNHKSKILNHKLHRYPFDIEIVLLLLISWVAIIVAGCTSAAFGIWKAYFFEPILVYVLIFNIFWRRKEDNSKNSGGLNDKFQVTSYELQVGKILWPLGLSALAVSVWAILQKIGLIYSPENFWPRVTGPFPYPNALGLYLGPIVLLMLGWGAKIFNFQFSIFKQFIIYKFKIFKILFFLITIILSLLAIFLAKSEGALIGIVIAFVLLISIFFCDKFFKYFKRPHVSYKLNLLKIFAVLIIALVYPLIALNVYPKYYYPNFENKYVNYVLNKVMLKDFSGEIRKQQWRETWQMLTESPRRFILGAGLSGYQAAIAPYHQPGIFYNFEHDPDFRRKIVWFDEKYKAEHWQPVEVYMYPHSFFLNFWSELGLAGALLFVWIILKFFYIGLKEVEKAKKRFKEVAMRGNVYFTLGIIGAMIVMIIHGIVDVPYFKNDLSIIFWVLLAMIGILEIKSQNNKNNYDE